MDHSDEHEDVDDDGGSNNNGSNCALYIVLRRSRLVWEDACLDMLAYTDFGVIVCQFTRVNAKVNNEPREDQDTRQSRVPNRELEIMSVCAGENEIK